jgi:hypothetical protein
MSTVVSCFRNHRGMCAVKNNQGKRTEAYHNRIYVSRCQRSGGIMMVGRDSESVKITFRRRQRSRRLGHMLVIGVWLDHQEAVRTG